MIRIAAAFSAAALLASCASGQRDLADQQALAQSEPAGPAVDCLQLSAIRDTKVRDDRNIDFRTRNGRVYRNTLPVECPGLKFEDSFSYRTSIGQLCSVDTITVNRSGVARGPTCGLGRFQPIAPPPRR
jgi:hypothetical protein